MKWFFCFGVVVIFANGLRAEDVDTLRTKRDGLMGRGMWRDALSLYQGQLIAVTDSGSGKDLNAAVRSLESLNAWNELDDLIEAAVGSHADDSDLLVRAAQVYDSAPHQGRLIAGVFERGGGGWFGRKPIGEVSDSGGSVGQTVDSAFRDFVRSMQLARQAIVGKARTEVRWRAWGVIAQLLQGRESWKLQSLTELSQLPMWGELGPEGGTEGAPWDNDCPVLYRTPVSWDSAINDGERWRFALDVQAKLEPKTAAAGILARADFSNSQFGSETLSSNGWRGPQDPDAAEGMLKTESLAEDECLAKTSDGVRRFRLSPEFHFIALYRSILDDRGSGGAAGDRLCDVFLNRRQYDQAKNVLEKTIATHGPGHEESRKKLLQQITGNWGRFEPVAAVAVGTRPRLPLVFRNATQIKLTAAPVDMGAVADDTMEYLKRGGDLDWERVHPGSIAGRLIKDQSSKYLGSIAAKWDARLTPRDHRADTRTDLEVPIDRPGAWWIRATMPNGNSFCTLVWIVDSVLLEKGWEGTKQWWLADAVDGAPIMGAEVEFFGFRTISLAQKNAKGRRFENRIKQFKRVTDDDGRVVLKVTDFDPEMQWMAVARRNGSPPTISGFESIFAQEAGQFGASRDLTYAVSDRPIYKPGDPVHVKFFFRNVGYSEPNEEAFSNKQGTLVVQNGRGDEVIKIEKLKTDALGALESEWMIPKDAVLGNWNAVFSIGSRISSSVSFRVEEYRKPEYEVKVEAPSEPVKLGEKFKATVVANYFHGSPVRNAIVEVIVKRSSMGDRWFPCGRWDWLYGLGSWWNSSQAEWHPSWESWSCKPPNPPWWTPNELVSNLHVPIGPDGKATIEIDTSMSKRIHGDLDAKYSIDARVVDASRREERGTGTVIAARKPFEVVVWLDRGYARAGDEVMVSVSAANLSGKPVVDAKGRLSIFRLSNGDGGRLDEREVGSFQVVTDAQGEIHHRFAAPPVGQYRVAMSLTSNRGDRVDGGVILNVHGPSQMNFQDWHFGALEIIADQATYESGDVAKLRVNSDHENAHVWLFQQSADVDGHEARRIQLDGKSLEVEVPVKQRDMPNFFIEGVTVHDAKVHTAVRQILVPPVSQVLDVVLEPAKAQVRPHEESSLRITVRDAEGKPFVGMATLSVYDKSLEAITGGSNVGSIQENFWGWKNFYRRNVRDFLPIASGSLTQPNTIGMESLGVFGFERSKENRAFAPSRTTAQMAKGAAPMLMQVQDQVAAPTAMPIAVRKEFADLLKWSGNIQTDSNGCAEIPLKFPDNLTTWKARLWVLGSRTRVGEGTAEVITSKKLFVRLQAPRFMVERDESVFSAVVQNENDAPQSVNVSLDLDGRALEVNAGSAQTVQIQAHHEMRVDWRVRALHEGEATIRMRATTQDDGDVVERKIPVKVHGMMRQDAWSRVVPPNEPSAKMLIDVPEKRRSELSKLTIRFSPTVAGAVVDTIPYLASDPNGCTEQTLNRFVPLMIARKILQSLKVNLAEVKAMRASLNPQELGDSDDVALEWKQWQTNPVFDEVEMERMTEKGIERLASMQNTDGGWGWFSGFGEVSYPHTTAVVVHGLWVAKSLGAKVPDTVLASGVQWLVGYEKSQLGALKLHGDREALRRAGKTVPHSSKLEKENCDAMDAFVRQVLGGAGHESEAMLEFLYRDRIEIPVYAKCLVGLELVRKGDVTRRDEVVRLIGQFLKHDSENQTAYLDLGNSNPWWRWYGSETEANAWYLKLLSATNPSSTDARGLVKYLANRRKHGGRWSSTRESAYAIEAIGDYLFASGEDDPEMEVDVLMDGKSLRHESIRRENLFAFNPSVVLKGDLVETGRHVIEMKRSGKGALYGNAFLEVFTQEDRLRPAGLEVKVTRRLSKMISDAGEAQVPDSSGQLATQQAERFHRELLKDGDHLMSGDRVEVELVVESKNDYEYLIFSDAKAAGFEIIDPLSGYVMSGDGISVYRESKDQAVSFFIRSLPRGKCAIRYEIRAETPGIYKALPTTIDAMYAPELRGNSGDLRLDISQ